MATKPETTELRNEVVRLWNKCNAKGRAGITQAELAGNMKLTRGAVGRLLFEARRRGRYVISITASEAGRRQSIACRKTMGEPAYKQRMAEMRASKKRPLP